MEKQILGFFFLQEMWVRGNSYGGLMNGTGKEREREMGDELLDLRTENALLREGEK